MKRLHLFEFQDQPWLPRRLRDALTDLLRAEAEERGLYLPIVPRLLAALLRTHARVVIDLASGAGGPVPQLVAAMAAQGSPVRAVLTDRFPNRRAFERAAAGAPVTGWPAPVDARRVPAELAGFRTLFSGFHHFDAADATAVLRDAVACGAPIAIFERTWRTPRAVPGMLVAAARMWWRPPRAFVTSRTRFVLTRIVPVIPSLYGWDGLVSHLRSYRPAELRALAAAAGGDYHWTAGVERRRGAPITFLIGVPARP